MHSFLLFFNTSFLPIIHHKTRKVPSKTRRQQPISRYRIAIAREVATTFSSGILAPGVSAQSIDLATTRRQHAEYIAILRQYVHDVHLLPPLDECPDSVFVEDTAIVIDQLALQGTPGHPTREAEVSAITPALQNAGLQVQQLENATFDGGDLLYTRALNTLFVGISDRTTHDAARALGAALEGTVKKVVPVHMPVDDAVLHLKSVITWVDAARRFVVQDTPTGRAVYEQILQVVASQLALEQPLWVPSDAYGAANVLDLGSCVVLQRRYWEHLEPMRNELQRAGVQTVACEFDEFAKANGSLTCCSILV